MDPSQPAQEIVLFGVVGVAPAILTETAWALAHESPPTIPHRVTVVTTKGGRQRIREELLASGVWEKLRAALKANNRLEFGDTGTHIRVITRGTDELDDIRSPADNAATADFILDELRREVENSDVRVVATLAGGRKTMSALLYACMTLIGRECDRITHVLVNHELENRQPKFYFPRSSREAAGVQLADIPFIPLRNRLTELGQRPGRFTSLIARYRRFLQGGAREACTVKWTENGVIVDAVEVPLRRRAMLVLKFLVGINQRGAVTGQVEATDDFIAFVRKHAQGWWNIEEDSARDDLKRELNYLRRRFLEHNVPWMPGLRSQSLRLPPFRILQ